MKARSGTRTGVTKGCAGLGRCGGCWLNRPSVGSMSFGKGMAPPVSGPGPSTGRARRRRPVGKRLARSRADRASDQAERIHTWEPDHGRWAITAEQEGAVTAVLAGVPTAAWQEPEQGGGDQGAEAVPPMNQTKAAFRLSLKREARPPPDLFDAAAPPGCVSRRGAPLADRGDDGARGGLAPSTGPSRDLQHGMKNRIREGPAAVGRVRSPCRGLPDRRAGVPPLHRRSTPRLSARVGVADDRDGPVEAHAGGRAHGPACGTDGGETAGRGGGAGGRSRHSTARRRPPRGALTRARPRRMHGPARRRGRGRGRPSGCRF